MSNEVHTPIMDKIRKMKSASVKIHLKIKNYQPGIAEVHTNEVTQYRQ